VVLTALIGFVVVALAGWGNGAGEVARSKPKTALDYVAEKCMFDDVSSGVPAAAADLDCLESVRMTAPYPTYSGVEIERTLEEEASCIASKGLEHCRPASRE
jgi:hypothetical protein